MSSGVITLLRGCSFLLVFVLACVVTTERSTELSCSLRHNDDRALTNKSEQCPTIPNTDWMTRVDLIKLRNCQFLFQCMSLCKAGKSVKKDFNSIKIKDQLCRKPCRLKNFITWRSFFFTTLDPVGREHPLHPELAYVAPLWASERD